ncbi:MAG TPA: nicotinamide-nucleotide amidohydrolase family protein, partial [Gemmatimonadales bacterium]|nr:nicotinamide-nucleotide amidohydrolase family protein [Gemmatimonadales bacterium]
HLGVAPELLERHGAVSAEVAEAMALGALAALDADLTMAVTGIAGPGGGTAEKPVGLVFVATAMAGRAESHRLAFPGDRGEVRERAAQAALFALFRRLREPADRIPAA